MIADFSLNRTYQLQYESSWAKIFGNKHFVKQFFKLAIPAVLQTLISIIVLYVDNFSLALLIDDPIEATAAKNALGLANPIINLQVFLSVAWLGGTGVMMAQYYGANDVTMTRKTTAFRLWTSFVVQLPLIVLTTTIPGMMIDASSGTNSGLGFDLAVIYLFFSSLAMVPYAFANTLSFALQETHQPLKSFIFVLLGMITNIILDPIVIIFSKDVYQAVMLVAISTIIARFVQLGLSAAYIYFKKDYYLYFFNSWKICLKDIKTIFKYGCPAFINELLYSLLSTLSVICLLRFNPTYHSATTNVVLIIEFTTIIWPGIAAACNIMVGSELGKNNIAQAKINANKLLSWGCVFAFFISFVVFILGFFINPILSPAASSEMNNLATAMEWLFIVIIATQGIFSVLYYSIRAGGSKVIILIDGLIMVICNSVMCGLTFSGISTSWHPLLFLLLCKYEEIIKMFVAIFIFKYYKWANVLVNKYKHYQVPLNLVSGEVNAI